jgi:hypothetical protein
MAPSIASRALWTHDAHPDDAVETTHNERRSNMKTVKMLAILTLAMCAFTAAANAQSVTGRFTLPYEVHWGTATLPAGEYTIRMDSLNTATLVQSVSNSQSFFTRMPTMDNNSKLPTSLVITSSRGERRVRSLNLPQYRRSLIYEPLTKAEREQLAKAGQIQSVPVFTARK